MSEIASKTICVVDHGLFLPFAQRLAREFGRVLYHVPQFENGYTRLAECVAGDGFEDIEKVSDFWELLEEIDCFAFPDIQHSGLQRHLSQMGKPVWGARRGDRLETRRQYLMEVMTELGLPVPKFVKLQGVGQLREHLKTHSDKFIKISNFRGDFETFHHLTYEVSRPVIDSLAVDWGPAQDQIEFIVQDPIETEIEAAIDTYCVDGEFPNIAVHGIERKDEGYLGSVMAYSEMPEELRSINDTLSPLLKKLNYRQFWAAEVRISEDDAYLTDPCCRHSSPAGETLLELFDNLPEIVWAGAHGELINPVPSAVYGGQLMLQHTGDDKTWRVLDIPKPVRQWVKLFNACRLDDHYCVAPALNVGKTIGSIVAIGDSVKEVVDRLKEYADALGDQPVKVNLECMADAIKEAEKIEDEGMKFSGELPKPQIVLS